MSTQLIVLIAVVTVVLSLAIGYAQGKKSNKVKENDPEELAAIQHAIWSHWMEYLFSISTLHKGGHVVIRKSLVDKWVKQMNTDYKDLKEHEKQSDRNIISKFMPDV